MPVARAEVDWGEGAEKRRFQLRWMEKGNKRRETRKDVSVVPPQFVGRFGVIGPLTASRTRRREAQRDIHERIEFQPVYHITIYISSSRLA